MKFQKYLFYSILVAVSVFIATIFSPKFIDTDYRFLETSMLSILNNLLEASIPNAPDLTIDKIAFKKVADPSENFNYYRYRASIHITNSGGDLTNATVKLSNDADNKANYLKNSNESFSLKGGDDYTLRNYEFIFDGRYNGGLVNFSVDIQGGLKEDLNLNNNVYALEIFEPDAQLDSIGLSDINDDGAFIVNFDDFDHNFTANNSEVLFAKDLPDNGIDANYAEIYSHGKIYSYHWLENSKKLLNTSNWKVQKGFSSPPYLVQVYDDPFESKEVFYLYIKVIDKDSGYYKISDILKFSPSNEISRAQFAQLFVEYAKLELSEVTSTFYDDVELNEWYAPALQTLYDLGLTDFDTNNYSPSEMISRAEVLKTVLNYFDVDLVVSEFSPRFDDVDQDNDLYPYTQALQASEKGNDLSKYLAPNKNSTKEFLKYLINEYIKTN